MAKVSAVLMVFVVASLTAQCYGKEDKISRKKLQTMVEGLTARVTKLEEAQEENVELIKEEGERVFDKTVKVIGEIHHQALEESFDLCKSAEYTIIDELDRDVSHQDEGGKCDNGLDGWYRFTQNGTEATIPTHCVESKVCGAWRPLWLDLGKGGLPLPGQQRKVKGCPVYNSCCDDEVPVTIQHCGAYLIYRFTPTSDPTCGDVNNEYRACTIVH